MAVLHITRPRRREGPGVIAWLSEMPISPLAGVFPERQKPDVITMRQPGVVVASAAVRHRRLCSQFRRVGPVTL